MLSLLPLAFAHPTVLPHAHNPAATVILVVWAALGVVWAGAALRRPTLA